MAAKETSHEPVQEVVSREAALMFLEQTVREWDFSDQEDGDNHWFALQVSHWVLEVFGQRNNHGEYSIYPERDGVDGNRLPLGLNQLVAYTWGDEMIFSNENRIWMESTHSYIESDPVIPEWEHIDRLKTFREQLAYIRSHPEVRDNIVRPKVEIMPQVSIRFEPHFSHGWSLEFLINQLGVQVAPCGEAGKTWIARNFVVETLSKPAELASTTVELALLAAKNTYAPDKMDARMLDVFYRRMQGSERIPFCMGKFQPRPGNAVKNFLIETLLAEKD